MVGGSTAHCSPAPRLEVSPRPQRASARPRGHLVWWTRPDMGFPVPTLTILLTSRGWGPLSAGEAEPSGVGEGHCLAVPILALSLGLLRAHLRGMAGHTGRLTCWRHRGWAGSPLQGLAGLRWAGSEVCALISFSDPWASPAAPACGLCEVARLRQGAHQCCPEYECGMYPCGLAGVQPQSHPRARWWHRRCIWSGEGVDFPKPGR